MVHGFTAAADRQRLTRTSPPVQRLARGPTPYPVGVSGSSSVDVLVANHTLDLAWEAGLQTQSNGLAVVLRTTWPVKSGPACLAPVDTRFAPGLPRFEFLDTKQPPHNTDLQFMGQGSVRGVDF